MNKKYYVAPSAETIGLHTESMLAASEDGFKGTLTNETGSDELSNGRGAYDSSLWSDLDSEE